MGAIGGFLGLNGGANGTGFAKPSTDAGMIAPTTSGQLSTAYTGSQGALSSQQALLNALQAQNGIGNQTQNYNQLQGVINGTGPNPAQAMLHQATGQNVANQAALMAGQRGASANTGLMARQAAQQGAAIQQNAVGQGATMQAQQSLGALGQAGAMANMQAGQQANATTANTQAQLQAQSNLLNANQGYNAAKADLQSGANAANASMANTSMGQQGNMLGGILNGAGKAIALAAKGGEVQRMAQGGQMGSPLAQGASSLFGQFINQNQVNPNQGNTTKQPIFSDAGKSALGQGASNMTSSLMGLFKDSGPSAGGMGAPGGAGAGVAKGMQTAFAAQGGQIDYRQGGPVQAQDASQKAVKAGNSYDNDKIPAVLSEHEIVIPRNITMGKDPVAASAKFVAQTLAKRKGKK